MDKKSSQSHVRIRTKKLKLMNSPFVLYFRGIQHLHRTEIRYKFNAIKMFEIKYSRRTRAEYPFIHR